MTKEKENILIAGANGSTGKIIVQLLQNSSVYRPIAMVRKEDQKVQFEKDGVTTVLADLENDVSHAFDKVDKVIFAAGSKGKNVFGVDQEGAKRLIDAGLKAQIKKYVMLSSIGADKPSISNELEDYLKAKQNADEHLRASGLDYTIVRPGQLTDHSGSGKIQAQEKLGKYGEIARADVAKTLVEALGDGIMQNEVFEIIAGETPIEKALTHA